MINRICCICSEWVDDVWVVTIKDNTEVKEYSGHYKCITDLHNRIKLVKNLDSKSVKKVVKELNL